MFTINIYLKFALTALFLVVGIVTSFLYGLGYGILFIIIGLGFLASYILLGTVQSAAELLQTGDIDAAEKRLNLTWKPNWLYVTNRAYYFLMHGTVAMHRKDSAKAEQWFQKAEQLELPSDNERAMVQLQLASINANKGKWKAAQLHFRNAKKYKTTEAQIKDQIKDFEKMLNNRGAIKQAQRMNRGKGMPIKPGGKRRRPKIR
ncbi:MAG TPA: hypothetical protein ENK52_01670 [Saprospiraceae bacterium]|nr:hypothetical protein [Saprospiraceae bacterium]